jgi:hypothetical protein
LDGGGGDHKAFVLTDIDDKSVVSRQTLARLNGKRTPQHFGYKAMATWTEGVALTDCNVPRMSPEPFRLPWLLGDSSYLLPP